jgi:CMP-N-acetylneuraminic acid synthetase
MTTGTLGFVPARGGSVGIRDKNLRPLAGKPLVARAVETLLAVPGLDGVLLSTDTEEIARAGREAGAEVPFLRPSELATPEASVLGALAHAVEHLEAQGRTVRWVVMVQPTSPFVRPATVRAIVEHAQERDLPLVQTVSPVKDHPYWVRVPAGDRMYPFHPAFGSIRRQDLPELLVLNGAVNVYRADTVRARSLPAFPGYYVIDRFEGFDIDDAFDLRLAELLAETAVREPAEVTAHVSH